MELIKWFTYFDISIAVQKTDTTYKCIKYLDGEKLVGESIKFNELKDLELYLLEHPGCPRVEVMNFIEFHKQSLGDNLEN